MFKSVTLIMGNNVIENVNYLVGLYLRVLISIEEGMGY